MNGTSVTCYNSTGLATGGQGSPLSQSLMDEGPRWRGLRVSPHNRYRHSPRFRQCDGQSGLTQSVAVRLDKFVAVSHPS